MTSPEGLNKIPSQAVESLDNNKSVEIAPPRITGNDLPDDVWRIIVVYLHWAPSPRDSESLAFPLISVNRSFFNFVLSTRYRDVHWISLDKPFYRTLQMLQSPVVGGYVQNLFVRSWFFDLLHKRDSMLKPSPALEITSRITDIMNLWFPGRRTVQTQTPCPQYVGFEASHKAGVLSEGVPTKDLVKLLIRAAKGMVNVTTFDFEWRDLSLDPLTAPFFTSMKTAFNSSLRQLVLKARISKFKGLLAFTDFQNIDQLDLTFDYQSKDSAEHARSVLSDTVVPFIEQRRTRLRSLAITSWTTVDLSEFFAGLPSMPELRCLSIHISFDDMTVSNPSSILSILKNAKFSLLHVSLQTAEPLSMSPSWHQLEDELLAHRDGLRNLETLRIPFSSITRTGSIINRSLETLTSLSLMDKYLTNHETSQVADIFAQRPFQLQHLFVHVKRVDFALIRILSKRFLGLTSLVLIFEHVDVEYSYEDADEMERNALVDWKLTELDTHYRRSHPNHRYYNNQIFVFFLSCLPSLRRLNGHTLR